jgi:hypothetical protein
MLRAGVMDIGPKWASPKVKINIKSLKMDSLPLRGGKSVRTGAKSAPMDVIYA